MGDEVNTISNITTSAEIKARLRNHSVKSTSTTANSTLPKMSGQILELEEVGDVNHLILKEKFVKKTTGQKLDSVADAINKMYEKIIQVTSGMEEKIKPMEAALFDDGNGILNKVESLTQNANVDDQKFQAIIEEHIQLRDEVDILKGVVHKLSNQLDITNSKVHNLVAKSMEDNLVFTGILDDLPKRSPRKQLHRFLNDVMGLYDVKDQDIISVFQLGQPKDGKHRPTVAQCIPDLRRYILSNAYILKDKTNDRPMG